MGAKCISSLVDLLRKVVANENNGRRWSPVVTDGLRHCCIVRCLQQVTVKCIKVIEVLYSPLELSRVIRSLNADTIDKEDTTTLVNYALSLGLERRVAS